MDLAPAWLSFNNDPIPPVKNPIPPMRNPTSLPQHSASKHSSTSQLWSNPSTEPNNPRIPSLPVATPVLATARERDFPASNAWGKPRLTATSKPPTSSLVESSKGKKLVIMNLRSSLTTAGTLSRRRSADVKLSPCYQQPGTSSAAFTEDLLSISSQTSLQPSTPEIALLRDVYFIDLETTPVNKDSDPAFLSMNNATVQQPDADECLIAPAPFPIPSRSSPLPNDIQPVCDDDNISLEIDCSCPVTMLPLTIVPSTPSKTNDNENSQMSRSLEKELQFMQQLGWEGNHLDLQSENEGFTAQELAEFQEEFRGRCARVFATH